MILSGQTIDRDTLNRAYISKTATGTQIMAGSLRLLGNIQADGTTTLGTTTIGSLTLTGALNAGANNITTTGTISGTHSGNGAALTSLNGSNISSGTVADARLSTNVSLLASAQTITANKTLSAAANLYFAGGTTYKIDTAGSASFNSLNIAGIATFDGNDYIEFSQFGVAPPSNTSAGTKIKLFNDGSYNIGIDTATVWYDAYTNHKFFTNSGGSTRTERFRVDTTGANTIGTSTVQGYLDVQGEIKAGIQNEFPDPLLATKTVGAWSSRANTTVAYDIQAPSISGVTGSIKITVGGTSTDSGSEYQTHFPVSPNEWITFSAYAFATTASVTGHLYILFYDASNAMVGAPYWAGTYTTGWTRYTVTGQAPATATYFTVRVDGNTSGAIVYASAFQVERGRAMTGFKPYTGGTMASFFPSGIKLGGGGEIHSAYNNDYVIKDHNNGAITLSAAGSGLYLGFRNTSNVRLFSPLVASDTYSNISIIDTDGKLYYKGNDTDGRYVTKGADSIVTSKIRMEGATAQLFVANQFNVGSNPTIDLAIGDGDTGFDWVSDGKLNFMADSTVVASMGKALLFDFKVAPTLNGTKIWHEGNDGNGSGLDADLIRGISPSTGNTANTIVQRDASGNFSAGTITASLSGTATNISNTGTVTLATATESNAITITAPSYATDKPVKLLNFNWYNDVWSMGNIRSSSTPTAGLGIYLNSVEKFRFIDGTLKVGTNAVWHAGNVGAGSGLNADQVDGKHSSDLMSSTVYREKLIIPTGGYAALTSITIPNSRVYVLGSNRLQVFRDGWLQDLTDDYVEVTTSTIKFQYALPEDTKLVFIINNAG
jgi:hypothetical protein